MEEQLKSVYYGQSAGAFQSLPRFREAVKRKIGSFITPSEIKNFYERQTVNQLSKTHKRAKIFRNFIFSDGLNRHLAMDGMYVLKSGKARYAPSLSAGGARSGLEELCVAE